MRYSPPLTEEALASLDAAGFREIVCLPLYPHECGATTGSSLAEIDRVIAEMNFDRGANHITKIAEVRDFADDEGYLQAMVERIESGLARFPYRENVHILFSAHGLPQRFIDAGDPYQRRILATVSGLLDRLGRPPRHSIAYQSRVGPEKWLQPDSAQEIERLAREGVREMLVVPVSFVSDHIETLHEIGIEYKEKATHAGIRQFECMEGLNGSPRFVEALERLVLRAVDSAQPAPVAAHG
jgi:ferrochelatase